MRRAAYCMAPVLLAILLWRAEFCVFFDRFYHTMEYRNFLFTGMSFFLTGQMIHEYQDKIVCKRLEQWMQWGLKAGMSFGVARSNGLYSIQTFISHLISHPPFSVVSSIAAEQSVNV